MVGIIIGVDHGRFPNSINPYINQAGAIRPLQQERIMKIQNRKGLIRWFNRHNGTTHKISDYTNVRLGTNKQNGSPCLIFKHNNKVGQYVIPSTAGEWREGHEQIQKFVY